MKNKETEMTPSENWCCCCGSTMVELWDICEVCEWQSDLVQNEQPDYSGGANGLSLNEYRAEWLKSQKEQHLA